MFRITHLANTAAAMAVSNNILLKVKKKEISFSDRLPQDKKDQIK
jgi:hypothetical protein